MLAGSLTTTLSYESSKVNSKTKTPAEAFTVNELFIVINFSVNQNQDADLKTRERHLLIDRVQSFSTHQERTHTTDEEKVAWQPFVLLLLRWN